MFSRGERKLNSLMAEQAVLTSVKFFVIWLEFRESRKTKDVKIHCKLGSVIKSPRQLKPVLLIFSSQNSLVESNFHRRISDGIQWTWWIFQKKKIDYIRHACDWKKSVKRRHSDDKWWNCWQKHYWSFPIDRGVKMNSTNYCDLMNKTFFEGYKFQPQFQRKVCIYEQ